MPESSWSLRLRRPRPDRGLADRRPGRDGNRRRLNLAAVLGMTFALLPEEKAGLAGGLISGLPGWATRSDR